VKKQPHLHGDDLLALMLKRPQLNLRHAHLRDWAARFTQHVADWWIASYPCPFSGHHHEDLSQISVQERTCLRGEHPDVAEAIRLALSHLEVKESSE